MGHIRVPIAWWDIAQHIVFGRVLSNDRYPVDVDTLSDESYMAVHEILSAAIKHFDISIAAIHMVSIGMC